MHDILINGARRLGAFSGSVPLPERYSDYCREGVSKIDSDFEAAASDIEENDVFKI